MVVGIVTGRTESYNKDREGRMVVYTVHYEGRRYESHAGPLSDLAWELVSRYTSSKFDEELVFPLPRQMGLFGEIGDYPHHDVFGNPSDVDHINGNSLDNRKQNLRICTRQQNICNAKKGVDCTSQYIGVSWDKSRNLWRVAIMFSRRSIYLGRFKIERDAATAYNEAAAKLFGEFARLNNV
jgi:hypothetical protein